MEALPLDKLSLEDKKGAQEQPSTSSKSKRSGAARRKLKKERLAKLPKLPPEIIGRLLELCYPPVESVSELVELLANGLKNERAAFLVGASLVARDWTEEAQRLLWQTILLRDDRDIDSFLLSANKKRLADGFALWPSFSQGQEIGGSRAFKVLSSAGGIYELSLANVGTIDDPLPVTVFAEPSLAGVIALTLHSLVVRETPSPSPISFAVQLLWFIDVPYIPYLFSPARLLCALLKKQAMVYLHVRFSEADQAADIQRCFASETLEPQLRFDTIWKLTLDLQAPELDVTNLVRSCTKLGILITNQISQKLLLAACTTLEVLCLRRLEVSSADYPEDVYTEADYSLILDWMTGQHPYRSPSSLRALELPAMPPARHLHSAATTFTTMWCRMSQIALRWR